MWEYLFLVLGFVFLIKGADVLVDGASDLAKRLGVSELIIGLTVVAFGTSMPELMVNIFAAFNNATDIAIGNIIGSNIANVLLILGVSTIIFPLKVRESTIWKEIPLFFLSALILLILVNDVIINGYGSNILDRTDGMVLLILFGIYMLYAVGAGRRQHNRHIMKEKRNPRRKRDFFKANKSILMIIVGIIGLYLGGDWTVSSAIVIAESLGISKIVISSTIIAIGTSLPELLTSAIAALKKNPDISIGNVVGSNIFNTFLILGITSILTPIAFYSYLNTDMLILLISSIILFFFVLRNHVIKRWQGAFFLAFYGYYIIMLLLRG